MLRRSFRLGLRLGILAALVTMAVKALGARRAQLERFPPVRSDDWPPVPAPPPGPAGSGVEASSAGGPAPAGGAAAGGVDPWVAPDDRSCPPTHPVKAKLSSRIFHLPGMAAYERTRPDRCYRDAEAARADGLRRAKR